MGATLDTCAATPHTHLKHFKNEVNVDLEDATCILVHVKNKYIHVHSMSCCLPVDTHHFQLHPLFAAVTLCCRAKNEASAPSQACVCTHKDRGQRVHPDPIQPDFLISECSECGQPSRDIFLPPPLLTKTSRSKDTLRAAESRTTLCRMRPQNWRSSTERHASLKQGIGHGRSITRNHSRQHG